MTKIDILEHKGSRFLWLDDYLWMWDTEQEKELQKELANEAHGDVLVAGYGFGLLSEYLLQNPKVKSVTTIEKYEEVIEKMKEFGKIHGEIIIGDYYGLLGDRKYDCIIGDIWPDISKKFLGDYVKFKEKARKLLNEDGTVLAWGKEFFEYLLEKK